MNSKWKRHTQRVEPLLIFTIAVLLGCRTAKVLLLRLSHQKSIHFLRVSPVVSKIILEFSKIDPVSSSHCYPVDRRGAPIPISVSGLHLLTLANVVNGVAGYFSGTDAYLSAG